MKNPDLEICSIIINHFSNQFNSYFFLERFRSTTAKDFNKEFMNIANANNLIIPQNVLNIMQNNC